MKDLIAKQSPTPLKAEEDILIRTFRFEAGLLHLERGTMTDADAADYYQHKGKLLEAVDGTMPAKQFYALQDFNDL